MAHGHGAAVDVHLGGIHPQIPHTGDGLGCKGLIEFDDVDLVDGEPGFLQGDGHRLFWAQSHVGRVHAPHTEGDKFRQRLDAQRFGLSSGHQHHHGGRVAHLGGGAGGDGAVLLEHGLELGQILHGQAAANALVFVEGEPVPVLIQRLHGEDLLLEHAGILGGGGPAVALQGQGILLLPGDVAQFGHVFGSEAHGHIGPRLVFLNPGAAHFFLGAHGQHGHGLHAAGHHHLSIPGPDHVDGAVNGLEAGRAEPVDSLGGHVVGQAGPQTDQAADVIALNLLTFGAADDHVSDVLGIQLGELVQHLAQHLPAEVHGMGVLEGALLGAAHRAAAERGNDDILRLKITHDK